MRELVKILIIDDDKNIADICAHFLRGEKWDVDIAYTGKDGLQMLKENERYSVVYLDLKLPDIDGAQLLKEIKRFNPYIDVVIVTGHSDIDSAIKTLKMGAIDYIAKPFSKEAILSSASRILQLRLLREEVKMLRQEVKRQYKFDNIVGISRKMKEVYDRIAAAADSDSTALIQGESGTGKDLVARSIHYNSNRSKGAFIALNCASMPESLIESELFGYKKGAFTGAVADAIGILRSADGGTLFLDEISDMPLGVQSRLLRFLENKKVRPVGGVEEKEVDVRIVCATNQDLELLIAKDKFRKDLFYRISVIVINLPPLRERREDIPLLVDHFISKYNRDIRTRQVTGITKDALERLKNYDWGGNVRELENTIRRAFVLGKNSNITSDDLPDFMYSKSPSDTGRINAEKEIRTLAEVEEEMVRKALKFTKNKTESAKLLGISRKRLYNLMERYKIKE